MAISKAIIDAGTMGALGNKPVNGIIFFKATGPLLYAKLKDFIFYRIE